MRKTQPRVECRALVQLGSYRHASGQDPQLGERFDLKKFR